MSEWKVVVSACVIAANLSGCSESNSPQDSPPPDRYAAVDAEARSAFESAQLDGMGLAIYDRHGAKVFERMYGDFSADRRIAIASASKIVSGTTIFRLIDQGFLSLDSTTGEVLGWTDEKGMITLRHLLSFTSGLPEEHLCTYNPNITLDECVQSISQLPLNVSPGTRFDYGSTHLHVAARMAEVVAGSTWNEIFARQLRDPLQLAPDIMYYTNPKQLNGTTNPLPAGGLRITMNEYARVLRFIFDKGRWQDTALIAPDIFDTQTKAPYPEAMIGTSPAQMDVRYGLTAWLECDSPQEGCATISSPGAFGFTPWLDREAGYYALLGMEIAYEDNRGLAVDIQRRLKPLIEDAITN